ncbi:MAG: glycoside hydrolase family 43 protein [Clostridia bacterium]|nr:glycoside hydrolase family 43 protein [Clostridia bacterium]
MKNLKKVLIPVALAVTMSLSAFLVACNNDDEKPGPVDLGDDAWRDQSIWLQQDPLVPTDEAEFPEDIAFTAPAAAVHDPSIFHDPVSGDYYAYGTHYAVAKTYNLANFYRADKEEGGWEQIAGDNQFSVLYGEGSYYHANSGVNWPEAIKSTVDLVNPGPGGGGPGTTTWAPDVELINGKYYMYYSLTHHFGSNHSAIARVEATSPKGPFTNNTIVIDSMGANAATDPNCIDPELFYDKDGKLWMVYGSDSAGIFIKELHADGENAGLPIRSKEEEGFGKLLWKAHGGAGGNEEGPFVFYNASTKYYYLMTSHASLMSTYNMHIARSQNPDGPYVGIDGNNVAEDGADGNLVSGNYKFNRSGATIMAALGHNSVVKDKDGKYYVVYHARTATADGTVSEGHKLYVSQMYFNEEGWPVMSATPYVGETRGTMTETQVAKSYDVVLHEAPNKTTTNYVTSVAYSLTADHKVKSGSSEVGTWTLKQNYYIELTIDGKTYKGVVAPGWDTYTANVNNQKAVVTITAVSNEGKALWAIEK